MNIYNTNIEKLTCTCLDWKETRKDYKLNDPRRLCKHIINKLDIDNLPNEIFKFKEDLSFYQKKEWGFKRDFDEIIELDTFTLLGTFGWINVYDENAIKYGVRKETFSSEICWANDKRPKNFSLIENFFIKESEKLPLPLEKEEHEIIINFIKEVLPLKKDYYIRIETSQFLPNDDGILYNILESKLTPEEKNKLEQELLQKYDEDEAYYKLGTADLTLSNNEDEFCIYEALTVSNNTITVRMYGGEKYKLERNYEYAKQLKESRELKDRIEKEKQEKIWREKLEKKRNIAKEKGVILTEDYKGDLYYIQNFYNFPINSSWDELTKEKDNVLKNYDTLTNLIKWKSINISLIKFNKVLLELDFITKEPSLNLNNWILKGKGLSYGINYIKESRYIHKEIPKWYKTHIFNFEILKLTSFDFYENIKMTTVLFEKGKFLELYNLVNNYIQNEPIKEKKKNNIKVKNKKEIEREEWLRHVNCPKCGEKTNIHKKDRRERSEYTIQRFYCNECKSMFQIKVDELEKIIQEYKENEINLTDEEIIENKENNKQTFLKRIFSFIK